ncbi:MAG TPA: selenide, water dikinase SelD, partial [Chitinophagales bacterium]|nr:selenide, water dikinase SelD [Chitinophagales bacterium]
GSSNCLIATADFFMPIVDNAFDFGRIAAANALSDVYAMGGKPIMALAILGWCIDKLPTALASDVLRGARNVCDAAGIPLAGGHTVDSAEPLFGLAVNGLVEKQNLKPNNTARENDLLYLTKPLGTGIVTTALKRGLANDDALQRVVDVMTTLNSVGHYFGAMPFVHAMTDVTGFGLVGHLLELSEGSGLAAELRYDDVPVLGDARSFAKQFVYPDNTMRNWKSYETRVQGIGSESLLTLCDPQTSGGLLVAVDPAYRDEFENALVEHKLSAHVRPIGVLKKHDGEKRLTII